MTLNFCSGRVEGTGKDPVDCFAVTGVYDTGDGSVRLTKTYMTYRVFYHGAADGDGVGGGWEIPYVGGIVSDRGEFRIWPDELAMEEALRSKREADVPSGV
jgi:hypothetical protein